MPSWWGQWCRRWWRSLADQGFLDLLESRDDPANLRGLAIRLHALGDRVFSGVSVGLLGSIFELPMCLPDEARGGGVQYRPLLTGGYAGGGGDRSFLPCDLETNIEKPLRTIAGEVGNHLVAHRLLDVLWERFRRPSDAEAAMARGAEYLRGVGPEDSWNISVRVVGRIASLARMTGLGPGDDELWGLFQSLAQGYVASERFHALPDLTRTMCVTTLRRAPECKSFGSDRRAWWEDALESGVRHHDGDPVYGKMALRALEDWHRAWKAKEKERDAGARLVRLLLDAAANMTPLHAATVLQQALGAATDRGLSGLIEEARGKLSKAVSGLEGEMVPFEQSMQLPAQHAAIASRLAAPDVSVPEALGHLALLPRLLEIPEDSVAKWAKDQVAEASLANLIDVVVTSGDGRTRFQATTTEDREKYQAGMISTLLAGQAEALVMLWYQQAKPRVTATSLVAALGEWHLMPPSSWPFLLRASERFAAGDWLSAGTLAVTNYEAALRGLLRAAGHSALKTSASGGMAHETLNSLMESERVKQLLGKNHCRFVSHLLCDSQLGINLRNNVAHGLAREGDLSPGRILLVWLLLVRLTCYSVEQESEDEVGGP